MGGRMALGKLRDRTRYNCSLKSKCGILEAGSEVLEGMAAAVVQPPSGQWQLLEQQSKTDTRSYTLLVE